jgi:hypothetical protein
MLMLIIVVMLVIVIELEKVGAQSPVLPGGATRKLKSEALGAW